MILLAINHVAVLVANWAGERTELLSVLTTFDGHSLLGLRERMGTGQKWLSIMVTIVKLQNACQLFTLQSSYN